MAHLIVAFRFADAAPACVPFDSIIRDGGAPISAFI
jgi:hypothetical protein